MFHQSKTGGDFGKSPESFCKEEYGTVYVSVLKWAGVYSKGLILSQVRNPTII